nr:hypothetical protein [Tanacetum cinerariifolium]
MLEVENLTNWKKRFMCHIVGIEPQFKNILLYGPYVPMIAGQRKPKGQRTSNERNAANLDQRLKILILVVLPDDQMKSVINYETAKSTWEDPILYYEGPFDVKESRARDPKRCYITFKFKEESELASLFGKLKYKENLIDNIYETEKKKSLATATPLLTNFFSTSIVQDFQDSPDDEEDTRSSEEYLNDLKEEYQERALLAKSKIFFTKGVSKNSVPSYSSPFQNNAQPKFFNSSQQKLKLRPTKYFEAKYNKVKAKLALLNSSASASKSSMVKNKGLVAEAYEWDKKDVSSDDNEMVKVKVLMALTDDENVVVGKESARNANDIKVSIRDVERPWLSEAEGFIFPNHDTSRILPADSKIKLNDPSVTVTDSSTIKYDLADESLVCSTYLPPLKKLAGGVTIVKPTSAPAKGNKNVSASKNNSTPAGILKNVKTEDGIPVFVVMKEMNDLKLKINRNQSSYFRNNNPNRLLETPKKYKTQLKKSCELCRMNNHLLENCYKHLKSQDGFSSRSHTLRPLKPFPPCKHYGFNDHQSDDYVNYPTCETLLAKKGESSNATYLCSVTSGSPSGTWKVDAQGTLGYKGEHGPRTGPDRPRPDWTEDRGSKSRTKDRTKMVRSSPGRSGPDTYEKPKPIITEADASFDHDQVDQTAQLDQNDLMDQNDHPITKPLSSLTEDASAQNAVSSIQTKSPSSISSMAYLAPQDRWFKDKHTKLVNIIGNPEARMLTRVMAKELSAALAHECLFIDLLSEEDPKKDLLKKYDINGSSVKTPMVPPNILGHDLNGKSMNYRANHKESHLIAVKRIFRKSTSLACQLLGGKLVCWSAKKQQSVAMSLAEAEYVAAAGCCVNILWMKSQLTNYNIIYDKVGCELCKGSHYTKDCPLKEQGKTLEEAYYTQFGALYQPGGQYKAAGPEFYQRNNGNFPYPDRRQTLEESLTKFIAESAKRHEENSNIIKEI